MAKICIIDGQGGGIGATLVKYIKKGYGERVELVALGTNPIATAQILRAGADSGASGENAIRLAVWKADCIIGPIAITWANAMLGEVTPAIAEAITSCPAPKILIPLSQERIDIVGIIREPLPHLVERVVNERLPEIMKAG